LSQATEAAPVPHSETVTTTTVRDHAGRSRRRSLHPSLLGGGIDGNEQLTAMTAVVLIVLLAVLGLTIVRIGQLIWLHLFLGLLLLGPVVLKMGSTGYRFLRYYAHAAIYRAKGPPNPALRAMGPVVVLTTLVVFVSGVVLLFHGPRGRGGLLLLHKASFIVWLVFIGVHVLAHLPGLGPAWRAVRFGDEGLTIDRGGSGTAGRWLALAGALVVGLVLALVLIPHFGVWTAPGALHHHGEH
jgi:hypothetical protein